LLLLLVEEAQYEIVEAFGRLEMGQMADAFEHLDAGIFHLRRKRPGEFGVLSHLGAQGLGRKVAAGREVIVRAAT